MTPTPTPTVTEALKSTQATLCAIRAQVHSDDCEDHIHELAGNQLQENAAALAAQQPCEVDEWVPKIGERVHCAPHVADAEMWNREPMFVAGIRWADYPAGALDVTIAEEWPPHGGLTDGYLINRPDGSPDDLRAGKAIRNIAQREGGK